MEVKTYFIISSNHPRFSFLSA
ncbi:MAG: hypothetical protein RJB31_1707, partial [Bacteroidota bacterium]